MGTAVVCNPDICATSLTETLNFRRMHAATAVVDVHAVWIVVRHGNVGSQLTQNARRGFVGGAVRHIHSDTHFFERHPFGETSLCKLDIAAKGIVDAGRPSDSVGNGPD